MIPQLYTADRNGYPIDRVGGLFEADACLVTQEINGEYALNLSMPIGAKHSGELIQGYVIKSTVDRMGDIPQNFVITSSQRELDGHISVYATHESYRFNSAMISPFLNGNQSRSAAWAIQQVRNNLVNAPSNMQISVEITNTDLGNPHLTTPKSFRSYLLEELIPEFGGEVIWEASNSVRWVNRRGLDNGAKIVYRGNLLSLTVEQQETEYETGIYPFYGVKGDANKPLVEIVGKILDYGLALPRITKIIPVDLTSRFESIPTQAQLLAAAQLYKAQNAKALLPSALAVERFEQKNDIPIQLGDTVEILCEPVGVAEKRRVRKMVWDALNEKITSLEVGDPLSTFASTILKG